MARSSYVVRAMQRVADIQKVNPKRKRFTASDTGASREAIRRLAAGKSSSMPTALQRMMKTGKRNPVPFKAPSTNEMEDMIKGRKK